MDINPARACVCYRLDLFDRAVGVVGCDGVWRLAGGSLRRLRMVSTKTGELHAHNQTATIQNTLATLWHYGVKDKARLYKNLTFIDAWFMWFSSNNNLLFPHHNLIKPFLKPWVKHTQIQANVTFEPLGSCSLQKVCMGWFCCPCEGKSNICLKNPKNHENE